MARSVAGGAGRNNSSLLLTFALASVLLILVYIYWNKTSLIRQLHDENEFLNKALQTTRADLKTLQDRVNGLAEELASTEQEKLEVEKKQRDLTLQVDEGLNKLRAVEDSLKKMTASLEDRGKELSTKETQLQTITTTMNDYKTKLDACTARVDGLSKDLVAAKDFGVSQQKAVADVEEKKNTIVKGLQDEIVTLKQQCPPPKQDSDAAA